MRKGRSVLLIENFAADFYKARLPLAIFLLNKGYQVYALVPQSEYTQKIADHGVKVLEYELNRKNKGIAQLFRLALFYRKVMRQNHIDIVHSFRFQPNVLNTLANIFGKRKVLLHITGLGIAFSNQSLKYRLLRVFSQFIFAFKFLVADVVITQNKEDAKDIWIAGIFNRKLRVIDGSGIDIHRFDSNLYNREALRQQEQIGAGTKVFICVTRLIWEKGIRELVESFSILRENHKDIKLLIVGWPDYDNPRHVDDTYISQFTEDPCISFLGKRSDIPELLVLSDICIYPSYYREGIPRSLLEALSMRLPVITTDMPGCNQTVIPQQNGILIGIKSTGEIIKAVSNILQQGDLSKWGELSRELAVTRFSNEVIFSQIEKQY